MYIGKDVIGEGY